MFPRRTWLRSLVIALFSLAYSIVAMASAGCGVAGQLETITSPAQGSSSAGSTSAVNQQGGDANTTSSQGAATIASGGSNATGSDSNSTQTQQGNVQSGGSQNNTINGIVQSGNGWSGNIDVASTSAQYEAYTIDELLAKNGPLAQALQAHESVASAIRSVSAATGVPSGLLAGVAYQESTFDPNAVSENPDVNERDVGLTQAPASAFDGNTWTDPKTNLTYFANAMLSAYKKYNSWGAALRAWNSGDGEVDLQNLADEDNATDPNYIKEILATHCLGLD